MGSFGGVVAQNYGGLYLKICSKDSFILYSMIRHSKADKVHLNQISQKIFFWVRVFWFIGKRWAPCFVFIADFLLLQNQINKVCSG